MMLGTVRPVPSAFTIWARSGVEANLRSKLQRVRVAAPPGVLVEYAPDGLLG
jgi:hypothetical protein